MNMTLHQFIDGVGPTLRSIFPLTFKKNDPEAARTSYAIWHHALRQFESEQIVMNLIGWQATHTRAPKPREIKERLSPSDPGVSREDPEGHEEMHRKHRAEKAKREIDLEGISEEDMVLRKAAILAKRPSWGAISHLPAMGLWWRNLIHLEMTRGIPGEDFEGRPLPEGHGPHEINFAEGVPS